MFYFQRQERMASFDSSFWKTADLKKLEIPQTVSVIASEILVHEETFRVQVSSLVRGILTQLFVISVERQVNLL